jgi:hypothetical protein
MAWSQDAVEQSGWRAAGMDGRLGEDSLFVSLLNRAGNKVDWFTKIKGQISTKAAGAWTDVTVRITVVNTTPSGLPDYVAGPPTPLTYAPGTYRGILALDVPGDAEDIRVEGGDELLAGPDGPAKVIATVVDLPRNQRRTWTFRFRLPGRHGRIRVESSARWPEVSWKSTTSGWEDFAPVTVNY